MRSKRLTALRDIDHGVRAASGLAYMAPQNGAECVRRTTSICTDNSRKSAPLLMGTHRDNCAAPIGGLVGRTGEGPSLYAVI